MTECHKARFAHNITLFERNVMPLARSVTKRASRNCSIFCRKPYTNNIIIAGGYYFGVADHHNWYKVVEILGNVLYKHNRVTTPTVSPLEQPYVDLFGPYGEASFGSDSKAVANR